MSLLLFKFIQQEYTQTGPIAISQKKESVALTGSELFSSTVAFSQKKHSVVITDAEIFSDTIAVSQKKQSVTITGNTATSQGLNVSQAKESISITATNTPFVYIGSIAVAQNKHNIVITDAEIFSDTIAIAQKKHSPQITVFSANYSTIGLTQKKEQLLLSATEAFVGTVSPSSKKNSPVITAVEKFIASLTISSTKHTLAGGKFTPLPIYPSLFAQKKQSISITSYTGAALSISSLEGYKDFILLSNAPLWGYSDTSSYTDAINFEVTTGIYSPNLYLYIYDSSKYTDASTSQSANAVTMTIQSTRPRIISISTLSSYTDKVVLKPEPQNFNVISLFISTNSTYRG
jgi:hypothetical protein